MDTFITNRPHVCNNALGVGGEVFAAAPDGVKRIIPVMIADGGISSV